MTDLSWCIYLVGIMVFMAKLPKWVGHDSIKRSIKKLEAAGYSTKTARFGSAAVLCLMTVLWPVCAGVMLWDKIKEKL